MEEKITKKIKTRKMELIIDSDKISSEFYDFLTKKSLLEKFWEALKKNNPEYNLPTCLVYFEEIKNWLEKKGKAIITLN